MSWLILLTFAGLANMTPVSVRNLPILDSPISAKYFGVNKTWRGLALGSITPATIGYIFGIESFLYILTICFGALAGDLFFSFIKRRLNINPGQSWFPFDQLDWVIGALAAHYLLRGFDWNLLIILPIGLALHLIIKYTGFKLGIDNKKF